MRKNHFISVAFITSLLSLNIAFADTLSQATAPIIEKYVSSRNIPVPQTVSKQLQNLIAASPDPDMATTPSTAHEWKVWVAKNAEKIIKNLPALREAMQVDVEKSTLANVPVFIVTPKEIAPENTNRVLLHFHGGGYVLNPGEAGTDEAIMMAGYGKIKVISVDYRMPPDFPYPAAMDDAFAVYKELIKTNDPKKIAVFGTSTGGGMALSLVLRAKDENLPLPAAIAAGTPWSDLTKTGDSYYTNDGVDNVLVHYEGWLKNAALLYANGHDLKDPYLSPIYGDFSNFPPTLLTTGTRDLFLSNTIRVHRKLLETNVQTSLNVFEGLSHAQYLFAPQSEETKQHFQDLKRFFIKHLEQ